MISCIPYGTSVTTKIGDIKCLITAICIRDNNITYEISYFNNGEYKSCWVREIEFTIADDVKRTSIGYASN